MNKLLKEPLLHFLVIGFGLFVLFELVASDDAAYDSKVINVDRDSLLTFVQFRTRAFEPEVAAARLDAMSGEEVELMIADYVREEALHREAQALGVEQNDYVIKRRMIQSVEFVTKGFITAATEISEDDVQAHYEAHREDYFVRPVATFTHVFFNAETRGREGALDAAAAKLEELNAGSVPFNNAPQHGDRFPYFVNYVERDAGFVASHFGAELEERIFALEPSESVWRGPFESAFGAHLIMLIRKTEGEVPELAEIFERVRGDTERASINERQDKAIQAIVDTYEVRRSL